MNYGIIKNIEEVDNIKFKTQKRGSGYKITADKEIYILIEDEQQCCEEWGYLSSNDDFERFIGAKIYTVEITNGDLISKKVLDTIKNANTWFVTLQTSYGAWQCAVYNEQNGYYGHDCWVIVDGKIIEEDNL